MHVSVNSFKIVKILWKNRKLQSRCHLDKAHVKKSHITESQMLMLQNGTQCGVSDKAPNNPKPVWIQRVIFWGEKLTEHLPTQQPGKESSHWSKRESRGCSYFLKRKRPHLVGWYLNSYWLKEQKVLLQHRHTRIKRLLKGRNSLPYAPPVHYPCKSTHHET